MKQSHIRPAIDAVPRLRMPKDQAILKICDKIKAIDDLSQKTYDSIEFEVWHRETETLLIHAFGPESRQVQDFRSIHYVPMVVLSRNADARGPFLRGLQSARASLLAIVNEIQEFYPDTPEVSTAGNPSPTADRVVETNKGIESSKVFVVHGHDEGMKASVAGFLEKLSLQPVILHKQPNGGKTIIEKFEANADVAFAVVLMSPDDEGRERIEKEEKTCPLRKRARQNVILELGYFIGRLGRERVCALKSGDIETPSDILGVLYVPYDSNDGWKIQLIKELRAAGISLEDAKCATALMS